MLKKYQYMLLLFMIFSANISYSQKVFTIQRSSDLKDFGKFAHIDSVDITINSMDKEFLTENVFKSNFNTVTMVNIETDDVLYFLEHIKNKNSLKKLSLNWVDITKLISELKNFPNINDLELIICKLDSIKKLNFLHNLSCLSIQAMSINLSGISQLGKLNKLNLFWASIDPSSIDEIFDIKKLKELSIAESNAINVIPDKISNLNDLSNLTIVREPLNEISDGISKLTKLKIVYIAGALNVDFNKFIENLRSSADSLVCLILQDNGIRNLPDALFSLNNIDELAFEGNHLSELDDRFSKLQNLEILFVKNNDISKLSDGIKNLSKLNYLDLRNNVFDDLQFLNSMPQHNLTVELEGNPINRDRIDIKNP